MSEENHWTHEAAVGLCRLVEGIAKNYDCHVALTGGTLYKDGKRKDCDILFYRVRQKENINLDGLWAELASVGIEKGESFSDWLTKATYCGRKIDCFFPEGNGHERWDDNPSGYQAFIDGIDDVFAPAGAGQ